MMRAFLLSLLLAPCLVFSQESTIILPTADVELNPDSSKNYIYCATMELMWKELSNYIGEEPLCDKQVATVEQLNKSVNASYTSPIEDKYIVARSGLFSDSIVQVINSELDEKFQTSWRPPVPASENSLIAYSHLEKNVRFKRRLGDNFSDHSFNKGVNVDYFGIDLDHPETKRSDVLIHDLKSSNDFIIQVKCRDSLDEIYFAKVPLGSSLMETYQNVLNRVNSGKTEQFTGKDILMIPYQKFDTTKTYSEFQGLNLENQFAKDAVFQIVQQRIKFDLNREGIKLESNAVSIIDFADFEHTDPPRIFAFNQPFLIIMKRKNMDSPYFLQWVGNSEFMISFWK